MSITEGPRGVREDLDGKWKKDYEECSYTLVLTDWTGQVSTNRGGLDDTMTGNWYTEKPRTLSLP